MTSEAVPPSSAGAAPALDHARLHSRLAELAAIGSGEPGHGTTRLAYSRADLDARSLVQEWMEAAGLTVTTDAATNTIGRRGDGAAVVIGSHLDTVVDAGPLDGAYGVVAAIEVADALTRASVPLDHGLSIVAFANEEGAAGTPCFAGSLTIAGTPPSVDVRCDDGRTLGELLLGAGGRPDQLATAAWPEGSVAHFVELHVEQGPVLDRDGLAVGVVEGITGRTNVDLVIRGEANHAGTTPMNGRRDAMVAAAQVVLIVDELARSGMVRTATVGHLRVEPNVRNVVPGLVRVGVDLRDLDDGRRRAAVADLSARAAVVAADLDLAIDTSVADDQPAVLTDPAGQEVVESIAAELGLSATRLPSGAGHDAQVMAGLGPITMLFVPSRDGISHSPLEHTDPDALSAGAEVLLRTVLHIDRTAGRFPASDPRTLPCR